MVLAGLTLQVSNGALGEGLFKERDRQQSLSPSPKKPAERSGAGHFQCPQAAAQTLHSCSYVPGEFGGRVTLIRVSV